jgi:fucose permease
VSFMDEPVPPTRSRGSEPPPPATAAWAYPGPRKSNNLSRSVAPLLAGYLTFGQYWGVWVVVFADYLAFHGFTEGEAGVQMSILAVVSIATMVFGSPRLQAVRLAAAIAIALGSMALGAELVAFGAGVVLLGGFLVLGVGNGLIDVFLNVAAQGLEVRHRRPVLQWLHASYAAGGISGALGAGIATAAGVSFRSIIGVAGLLLVATMAWNYLSPHVRALAQPVEADTKVSLSVFRRSRRLILPAVVIAFAFLVEGSMDVWSGVYLRNVLNATALVAGIAFAVFSTALAIGRLTAGRVLFGLGYDRTIQVSGVGAFLGGIVAASTNSSVVAGVAFLILGFFIASAAPAAFGMVGDAEEDPALAVAAMSTVGYSGFVVGPPLMGWLAETAGLRVTMAVIALSTLGVLAGGLLDRIRHGPSRARRAAGR